MVRFMMWAAFLACLALPAARADEPKDGADVVELKLIARKDAYAWDGGGKSPADFKKMLAKLANTQKKDPLGGPALPNPPVVDLALHIVNPGKNTVAIWVGGDANEITLDLKGPGVTELPYTGAFTQELRLSKRVVLAPGKHHEVPISKLADGYRAMSRFVYWTEPGEYTLTARYRLAAGPDEKGKTLTSNAVTLNVTAK